MKYYFFFFLIILLNSCANKTHDTFTFVQLNDPQLGMGGYQHDVESLTEAVQMINELNPDFVLMCGDLVNHANDSSFNDFLNITQNLNSKLYLVPGNHDIGKVPNDSSLSYYRKIFGKDYYSFSHKGYTFIGTNSLLWKTHIENESDLHSKWFENTLQNSGQDNQKIVFGHFPIFTKSESEEENYFNFSIEKRKELLTLFENNNVVAYLSGHKHELLVNNYKGIQLVTGETTSKNFDKRPYGFRLWTVHSDTLIHKFIPLIKSNFNQ